MEDIYVGKLGAPPTLVAQIIDSEGTKEAKIKGKEEQSLFIKPTPYNDFPQIFDEEGAEFVVTFIKDEVIGKATEEVSKFAKKSNMKLALTRLEDGFLIGNHGDIISNTTKAGKQHHVKKEFIYTNEGICLEVVKRKAAGGTTSKGINYTTKGIDQIKAMSEYGVKAKGWALLGKLGGIMNIFDAAQAVLDIGNGKASLSSMPGITPMTAAVNLLGVLGDMHWTELDRQLNEDRVVRIEVAKRQGIIALQELVNRDNNWNRGKEKIGSFLEDGQFTYYLPGISLDTANKLLAGEFKTIESLYSYFSSNPEVAILVKKMGHPNFRRNIFIVEAFYIIES